MSPLVVGTSPRSAGVVCSRLGLMPQHHAVMSHQALAAKVDDPAETVIYLPRPIRPDYPELAEAVAALEADGARVVRLWDVG